MAKQTGFFAWVRGLLGWPTDEPTMQGTALREGFFEAMLRETQFLANHPHYAGVLSRMDPIATNTVPVMAVALRRWEVAPAADGQYGLLQGASGVPGGRASA